MNEKTEVLCWQCDGEGYTHHDCGEDCCVCLHPEDNVRCYVCMGQGAIENDG